MPCRLISAILFLIVSSNLPASAETIEVTAQGETNKDIRIGVYINIQPDCTSGPLPTIRLVEPPAHGKVTVKKAKFSATNYKQCLALSVPASTRELALNHLSLAPPIATSIVLNDRGSVPDEIGGSASITARPH
jgi:hypothetical protein